LAAIKQLAGQTIWYGASNIGARFLNYLLTPLITYLLHNPEGVKDYGEFSLIYAWIAVANILFTYGFETGFFRFSNKEGFHKKDIFQTTFGSMVISSVGLALIIVFCRNPINDFLELNGHPEYISWCALLIGLDALSAIPFAKLRQEGRPRKYAFVKISGIVVNIFFVVLLLVYLPRYLQGNPQSALSSWYDRNTAVGFLILANVFQNLFVFLLLFREWKIFRFKISISLWKQIFMYSSPMIIIGIAAMINDVMDRQMLAMYLPLPQADAKRIVGIYAANYKLAIFVTLFVQAFKMAAEPFFFDQSRDKNAPQLYARVMKWFVITMALAFLFTALYLDLWKYFIGDAYRSGLGIVPILLAANICLGIYYNLSIWYKLTDKMRMGLYITLFGALITLIGNYFFIPVWGMYAAAWATFFCYFAMMITAYLLGQKYYPVPYNVKKAAAYLGVMLLLFFIHTGVKMLTEMLALRLASATVLMCLFLLLIFKAEKKELKGMPVIGKFIK
jgi:O-antigen/teichoic acid export membrane protein